MAVPGANVSRDTTVTVVNPTPPTNSPVTYQGSPPTPQGLAPLENIPDPLITDETIGAFHAPANGAVNGPLVGPDAKPPFFDEIAGKAEAAGTEDMYEYLPGQRVRAREAGDPYTDGVAVTPNASHPSYGFQTSEGPPDTGGGGGFGPELVVGGDFASATGWTLATGVTIAGGALVHDGDGSQSGTAPPPVEPITAGTYKIELDVNSSDGLVQVSVGGTAVTITAAAVLTPTHFSVNVTTAAINQVIRTQTVDLACSVDNLSVKRVL